MATFVDQSHLIRLLEWRLEAPRMSWTWAAEWLKSENENEEGWRLPTVRELVGLFDYDTHKPKFDTEVGYYWSASVCRRAFDTQAPWSAWRVDMRNGFVTVGWVKKEHHVRLVREMGFLRPGDKR